MTQAYSFLVSVIGVITALSIGFFVSKESKRSLETLNKKRKDFKRTGPGKTASIGSEQKSRKVAM